MDTTLCKIPSELLTDLCHRIGVHQALPLLVNNSILHAAWRAAVSTAYLDSSTISTEGINIIKKLVNLSTLYIRHDDEQPDASTTAMAQQLLLSAASALKLLTQLILDDHNVITGSVSFTELCSRLQNLHLSNASQVFDAQHALGLEQFTSLQELSIMCKAVDATETQLQTLCARLKHLSNVLINSKAEFPASVLATFPGSLTSLTALAMLTSTRGDAARDEHFSNAVSRLTNLRELVTNYAQAVNSTTPLVSRAFAQLVRLTHLELGRSKDRGGLPYDFAVLKVLPELKELMAHEYSLTDPFDHPALETVHVAALQATAQWRGKTAEGCKISRVDVDVHRSQQGVMADDGLACLPLMPQLTSMFWAVRHSNTRYTHLAALLCRQAHVLQGVALELYGAVPFAEVLPRELPACTWLSLSGSPVGMGLLQMLAMCSMPALQKLRLRFGHSPRPLLLPTDLAWLSELHAVREVTISGLRWGAEVRQRVQAAVQALLAGREVKVVV